MVSLAAVLCFSHRFDFLPVPSVEEALEDEGELKTSNSSVESGPTCFQIKGE